MLFGYTLGEAQVFQQISKVNNQSLEQVKGINQDEFGYMWFASSQGVFRYDGQQLVALSDLTVDSLLHSDREIQNIKKDLNGHLWFCGNNGVFFKLDPSTYKIQFYDLPTSEKAPDNTTLSMYNDGNDSYVAAESTMFRINNKSNKITTILPYENLIGQKYIDVNTIYNIVPDKSDKNRLWILSRGGLMSFNKKTEQFQYHTKTYKNIVNYMTTQLWNGEQDKDGILWLGGGQYGLKAYDTVNDEWKFYLDADYYPNTDESNIIREFYKKSDTEYWVMSSRLGLGTVNLKTGKYQYFPHEPDNLQSALKGNCNRMFKDQDGNFWIGGVTGVSFYNPKMQEIQKIKYPPRASFKSIQPVHTNKWEQLDEDIVLVGTLLGDGIYRANLKNKTISEINRLALKSEHGIQMSSLVEVNGGPPILRDIFKTSGGEIFVSDNHTVYFYNKNKTQLESCDYPFCKNLANSQVSNFIEDKNNNYWCLNNYRDLIHIDGKSNTIIKRYLLHELIPKANQISSNILNGIAEDQEGNIWVSSSQNLMKIDERNGEVIHPDYDNQQVKDFILSQIMDVKISNENKLYLVSRYSGLLEIDLNNFPSNKIFNNKNGLPTANFLALDIDQSNHIWMTSDNGLFLFDPINQKTIISKKEHGLVENNFNRFWNPYIEISDFGNVFYYTPGYFSWLNEKRYKAQKAPIHVKVNAFEIYDDPKMNQYNLSSTKEIEINYQQNYFNIHFGTDSYTLTENQNFKYQLSGFDDQWRSSSDAFASYTKVPPGEYLFSVLATDFMGNWSEDPATLKIKIIPPFWKATWFKLLIFLIIVGLSILAYRFWANHLREKERLKSEFEKKLSQIEMDALRAQMNPHFLFNCLNSIKNYALTKGPFETGDYITKFSYLIRLILQNSKTPRVLLADELEALTLYIEIEDLRFENRFDYEIKIDKNLELNSIYLPPLILQPYVENAIWHGLMHKLNGKGKLLVELKHIPGSIQCTIEDNGIGREKAAEIKARMNTVHKKSLGMQITKDRIELTNQLYKTETTVKIIDLKNNEGEGIGTRILVNIPILPMGT